MNVFSLIAKVWGWKVLVDAQGAALDAGTPVSSPKEQVGTRRGKPLYAQVTFTVGGPR